MRARLGLSLLACAMSTACSSVDDSGGFSDCVSKYDAVAAAPTWSGLKAKMLDYEVRGHVSSLRTQARGHDVGVGDSDAVRVVELVGRRGRSVAHVEVWRTPSGGWRAGIWGQCID